VKAQIVLEGLQGRSVVDICNDYQITQARYYQWRDQFLSNAPQAFETKRQSLREAHLTKQNEKLKKLVGELTYELKKSD